MALFHPKRPQDQEDLDARGDGNDFRFTRTAPFFFQRKASNQVSTKKNFVKKKALLVSYRAKVRGASRFSPGVTKSSDVPVLPLPTNTNSHLLDATTTAAAAAVCARYTEYHHPDAWCTGTVGTRTFVACVGCIS